jgi:hypothetical protein
MHNKKLFTLPTTKNLNPICLSSHAQITNKGQKQKTFKNKINERLEVKMVFTWCTALLSL